MVEDFVEFEKELLVDSLEEVRLFDGFGIESNTIASGDRDLEIPEEFYHVGH